MANLIKSMNAGIRRYREISFMKKAMRRLLWRFMDRDFYGDKPACKSIESCALYTGRQLVSKGMSAKSLSAFLIWQSVVIFMEENYPDNLVFDLIKKVRQEGALTASALKKSRNH